MTESASGRSAEQAAARATHLNQLNRHAEAERIAREALAENPDHPELLYELACALVDTDRAAEALQVADAAIASAPQVERGYRLRAIMLCQLGRYDEAVESADVAVRLAPDAPSAANVSTMTLYRAGRIKEAYAGALRYVELAPEDADAHCLVGDILEEVDELEHARRAYREALRLDQQHANARNNLAVLELRAGQTKQALHGFVDAGRMEPNRTALPIRNTVAVLWKVTWRMQAWLAISGVVLLVVGVAARSPIWLVRATAVIALLISGGLGWWRAHDLPPSVQPVVMAALGSDSALRTVYLGMGVQVVLLLGIAATGRPVIGAALLGLAVIDFFFARLALTFRAVDSRSG